MDLLQAAKQRHSVRQYTDRVIEPDKRAEMEAFIDDCNRSGDLSFKPVFNEPKAFDCFMARYGKFSGVKNYLVLAGKKGDGVEEKVGYYGAKFLLFAQMSGLNTCWVALTYKKIKEALNLSAGEKVYSVIAFGYGKTNGAPRKSKTFEDVGCSDIEPVPGWFVNGVNTALLAPTAMNQQKFRFKLNSNGTVTATTQSGFYVKTDLGIAKYFFNLGAGRI